MAAEHSLYKQTHHSDVSKRRGEYEYEGPQQPFRGYAGCHLCRLGFPSTTSDHFSHGLRQIAIGRVKQLRTYLDYVKDEDVYLFHT